jgi:carbon monoxide dehydrogenase subunit G
VPSREATFTVKALPPEVWKFLRDFEALCSAIPGVERLKVIDGRTAEFAVKEKVGIVPLIVELRAQIESEDPPNKLHAVARGQHVLITIDVALAAQAGGTQLRALFDVKGEGPLKPLVDRLFEKRASERTAQFAETLAQRFSAKPPTPAFSRRGSPSS